MVGAIARPYTSLLAGFGVVSSAEVVEEMNYDEFDKLGGCRRCQYFRPFILKDGNINDEYPDECYNCYEPKTKDWKKFKIKILFISSEEKDFDNDQNKLI